MIKVEGQQSLYRKDNGAIVNADWSAYEKAKQRKKEKERMSQLENRLDRIENLLERLIDVNKTT